MARSTSSGVGQGTGEPYQQGQAGALEAVAQERPEEASYRIDTFAAAAARRTSTTPAQPKTEPLERKGVESEKPRGEATPDSDRFDDEAGQ